MSNIKLSGVPSTCHVLIEKSEELLEFIRLIRDNGYPVSEQVKWYHELLGNNRLIVVLKHGRTTTDKESMFVDPQTLADGTNIYTFNEFKGNFVRNLDEVVVNNELDLRNVLHGHSGEVFFSPVLGPLTLTNPDGDLLYFESEIECCSFDIHKDGSYVKGMKCVLWPNEDMYKLYPNDPVTAWTVWKTDTPPTYDNICYDLFHDKETYRFSDCGDITSDICDEEDTDLELNMCSQKQAEKLIALNQLMNVRKYLEGDWKPDWDEGRKWFISTYGNELEIHVDSQTHPCTAPVYFSSIKNARKAVEILGEHVIRQAYTQDF